MVRFKLRFLSFVSVITISASVPARADIWGGDVVVLTQILANAIKQLVEMEKLVSSGQDTLGLLEDINRGINDSLRFVDSIGPYIDPGLYHDLQKTIQVLGHLQSAYGVVVDSPDKQAQSETDSVIAESLNLNNQLYDYAQDLDKVAETIKGYSHNVSPGGAAKLTAQSLGVMVHVMSRQVQAQGQAMKVQAQALAIQNKRDKDDTKAFLNQAEILKSAMKSKEVKFAFPRF